MTNISDPRSSVANDDRRIAAHSTPVAAVAQPYGASKGGAAAVSPLDMAAGVVMALMILGPLVGGVLRVG